MSARTAPSSPAANRRPGVPSESRPEPRPEFRLHLALTTRAARDVLALTDEAQTDNRTIRDAEARDQAAAALARLLGARQAYDVYLRNGGRSENGNGGAEQVVEVRVASDTGHAANGALLEKLEGKSLLLVGTEKEDRFSGESEFLLFNVRTVPAVWGQKDSWSLPARASFGVGEGARGEAGFPMRVLAAVAKLPEARAQRETMQRRLADWHRYLGVLERTARARQFSVTYKSVKRGPRGSLLIFVLDSAGEPVPWDKLRAAIDEPLEVRERRGLARTAKGAVDDEDDSGDWLLGYVAEATPERNELVLAVDDDVEKLLEHRSVELPRAARLVYKASGDLAQIRRLKFGLELLEQGYSENPRLSEFLFEAERALKPDPARHVPVVRSQLLQPSLNAGQLAAVEGALNAPDLFLIQGPPGTGKTTVIAEICYQNALRGQRTLIASQSNLAVDHALSRLVHHPRIRALRRGHADRVEVEGAPFLEDQVVGTWLSKTADSCERDLQARRDRIQRFEELLKSRARLEGLAAAMERYETERPQHVQAVAVLEARLPEFQQQLGQLNRSLERRKAAREALQRLYERFQPGAEASTDGDAPAAAPERLRWFNHPSVADLRASLANLEAALHTWDPAPAPPTEAAETEPAAAEEAPDLMETLQRAHTAQQRAAAAAERLAALRAEMDEWREVALDWYRDRSISAELEQDEHELQRAQASLANRRGRLETERATLNAKVAELATFDAAQLSAGAALQSWVEALTQPSHTGPLGAPPQFASPLAQELWAAAAETAQLHKLAALALELRTFRVEAQQLADLTVLLSGAVERLVAELKPETVSRPAPRRARRANHWRQSPLRALVAFDAHGDLHPASGADTAWQSLEATFQRLRRRPAWWGNLLGREQRRQREVQLWLGWLQGAAEDFARRRAELERLARHRAGRLQDRLAATVPALEAAAIEAVQTFGPQAERRLVETHKQLVDVEGALPILAGRLAEVEERLRQLAPAQAAQADRLVRALERLGTGRPTRHFQYLLRQLDKLPPEVWDADWRAACAGFDEAVQQFEAVRATVDPLRVITAIGVDLDADLARVEQSAIKLRQNRRGVEQDLEAARRQLQALDAAHEDELAWWRAAHAALPEALRPAGEAGEVESPGYVRAVMAASAEWAQELERERAYVARAEKLVADWAHRLRAADERDQADLRQIYIDNANVIGITCVQAGAYHFSREYRNFDCVIVDEVSKATPPELLLPMLKGARVVLVGDHKQLPPMIGPETLEDLATELGVARTELAHLERSLFKELFETAPPELRVMLTEQYRMHPQIMDAINQFYDDKLACGLPNPDEQRAHGFNLPWLRPEHHLLWINTPAEGTFVEQKVGTTYWNAGEVEVILRLLKALDTAWQPQVARGLPPKEVGVITFYGAQVRELKQRLISQAGQFRNLRLRVGTVDRFQGMERPIIIASLVRNNPQGNVGFARKPERVNVAFSRAQELLVIVGSRELFCERARDPGEAGGQARTIYGRVAEVVQRAGGLRRAGELSGDKR